MAQFSDRQRVEWWFSALCTLPWLVFLGPYVEACAARLALSKWPRPTLDDPKQLATAPLHFVFQLLFLALNATVPLLILLVFWKWRRILSDWRYSVSVGMFAVGLLSIWFAIHYDPGRVWDWFFD